jgi:hypothetical protein
VDHPTDDDTFELVPRRVGNARGPWPVVLGVAAAGLAIVIFAALAGGTPAAPGRDAAALSTMAVVASPAAVASEAAIGDPPATATATSRPLPDRLTCHDVDRFDCRLAVTTALGTLDGDLPAVASADVWSGLVCGDTLDCPPNRLDGRSTPLASVIVKLVGGGPDAWVNVVYRSHGRPLDFDPTLEAWIARWQVQP